VLELPVKSIKIGDRIREELGDIETLELSLATRGLLQPIVVEKRKEEYWLIAGYRRLQAWTHVYGFDSKIPVVIRENVSEIERIILELEENIRRKQLTWPEEVRAEARLFSIKKEAHAKALSMGRLSYNQRDFAGELNKSIGAISQDLELAANLSQWPELEKLPTRKAAWSRARQLKQGFVETETDFSRRFKDFFILKDLVSTLQDIPPLSVDLLILDLTALVPKDTFAQLVDTLNSLGNGFLFYSLAHQNQIFKLLEALNLTYDPQPSIWQVRAENDFRTFIWFSKTETPPPMISKSFSQRRDQPEFHKLEKPYGLYLELVNTCTKRSQFILEPIAFGPSLIRVGLETRRSARCYCQDKMLFEQIQIGVKT